jgi:hypothetical protein
MALCSSEMEQKFANFGRQIFWRSGSVRSKVTEACDDEEIVRIINAR